MRGRVGLVRRLVRGLGRVVRRGRRFRPVGLLVRLRRVVRWTIGGRGLRCGPIRRGRLWGDQGGWGCMCYRS